MNDAIFIYLAKAFLLAYLSVLAWHHQPNHLEVLTKTATDFLTGTEFRWEVAGPLAG